MTTTEEKAKAYDEALEQARKELNTCGSMDCDAARQIFRFFPQLNESEDERIRKELISFLQSPFIKDNLTDKTIAPWIAYLKKQKNLFKSGTGLYYYDGEKTTYCGCPATEVAMEQQEKQKEQKPAEWSEEDKKTIDEIEFAIYQMSSPRQDTKDRCIKFLYSLRPQWKPTDEKAREK